MGQLTVYFVRHGATVHNVTGRIQGQMDTHLSQEGADKLRALRGTYDYPAVERVYVSPAARARETAALLYPGMDLVPVQNLWEYSFGRWEGRLMSEVAQTPMYQKWLDQSPDCYFDGGETLLEASLRAVSAMTWVVRDARQAGLAQVAVVAHGEILSLLFQAALVTELPPAEYKLCPNGMGLVATADTEGWFFHQTLHFVSFFPQGATRPRPEDSPYFQKQ